MYSLKDILKQYFDTLNSEGRLKAGVGADAETKFLSFYGDKVKNFSDMIHALNIKEEMEILKKLTSTNYTFSERNKNFVIMLLEEHTGKFEPIRRGQIYRAESDFVIGLYEGFIDIFRDAGVENELLEAVSEKMNNRLNVPVRKLQSIREASYKRLETMINDKMRNYVLGINTMERYQWLLGLEADMNAFIRKWEDIFDIMSELRVEEINRLAEEVAANMSDEEALKVEIDWEYNKEFTAAVDADTECQELQRRHCQIFGVEYEEPSKKPIERHAILNVNQKILKQKKRPIVKKVEKEFNIVSKRLKVRYDEIRTAVIRKYIPDYEAAVQESNIDFSSLMPAEELMKHAIETLKENWEWEKEQKNKTRVELPKIDFDELRKKIEYIP